MKNLTLFLTFLIFSMAMVRGESSPERSREKDRHVMDLLLREEKALRERLHYEHGPQWRWQLMKLQMEKYKLIRREENEKFMKSSIGLRMKKKKKWFFSKECAPLSKD